MLSRSLLPVATLAVAACTLGGAFAGPAMAKTVAFDSASHSTNGLIANDQRIIDSLVKARVRASHKKLADARHSLGRAQTILLNLKQVPSKASPFYKTALNDVTTARKALAKGDAPVGRHKIAAAEGDIQNAVDARGTISEVAKRMH